MLWASYVLLVVVYVRCLLHVKILMFVYYGVSVKYRQLYFFFVEWPTLVLSSHGEYVKMFDIIGDS